VQGLGRAWGAGKLAAVGLAVALLALTVLIEDGAAAVRAGKSPTVPSGFIAMNIDGPELSGQANLGAALKQIRAVGVSQVRMTFSWANAQPYASWKDVPADRRSQFVSGPGGVPTDFEFTDLFVAGAAEEGLSLMPTVLYAPRWDGSPKGNHVQPAHDKPYAEYLSALVKRYGPNGKLWKLVPSIPKVPVVRWQIWNEPELGYFWDTKPFAPSYVKLLRISRSAIKAVDPSASIVLAALTNHSWDDLQAIYKVHGSRGLFDAVAADAYTRSARGVITILGNVRKVMNQYHDARKPLVATELGWPAAVGKTKAQFGFDTTTKGQAEKVSQLMPLLAKNRQSLGLDSYYYYTWGSNYKRGSNSPFNFSGLLRVHKSHACAQPSYSVFRQNLASEEGIQPSGSTPKRCSN
jgi:hypothetical protein